MNSLFLVEGKEKAAKEEVYRVEVLHTADDNFDLMHVNICMEFVDADDDVLDKAVTMIEQLKTRRNLDLMQGTDTDIFFMYQRSKRSSSHLLVPNSNPSCYYLGVDIIVELLLKRCGWAVGGAVCM